MTHVQDRPDVDALWQRIQATGLCTRTRGRVPIGVFLALHLCDKAKAEEARPPRTITRRVLGEFDAYHDPARQLIGGNSPKPPALMRTMTSLPERGGDMWDTPAACYRVDHASASLIPTDSPTHARLVAGARGWLRSELDRAGVPDGSTISVEFPEKRLDPGYVDGIEMSLDGLVGGSQEQKTAAARNVAQFIALARSERALASAADMAALVRPAMIARKVPDLLVGSRPGSVRRPYDEEDGPKVSWYALDLSGLGEDLLPRHWSIVASPRSEGIGENTLDAIRAERRNRKALKTGPQVERTLLAMLGMEAVRDLYAATSKWQRGDRLLFRGRRTMPTADIPASFPRELDHVLIRAGVLTAHVRISKDVLWSPGRLTIRRVTLPESIRMSLPGMPLRTVVEHPWLDPDAIIERVTQKPFGKGKFEYEIKVGIRLLRIEGDNPAGRE